jgi:hypothetical protein
MSSALASRLLPAWWSPGGAVRFRWRGQWVVGFFVSFGGAGPRDWLVVDLPCVGRVGFRPVPGQFFVDRPVPGSGPCSARWLRVG